METLNQLGQKARQLWLLFIRTGQVSYSKKN